MKSKVVWSKKSDEWETPQDLFDELNKEFKFTLDPCATKENAKCKKFYTKEDDGLRQEWSGEKVFVNPPYSEIGEWVKKAAQREAIISVMLLPARTDTRWFHTHFYNTAVNIFYHNIEVRFIKGRLKFGGAKNGAPFPSMIVVIR